MKTKGLKAKEAAEYLGVSVSTVRHAVKEGRLVGVKIGKGTKKPQRRFSEKELDKYLEPNRMVEPYRCVDCEPVIVYPTTPVDAPAEMSVAKSEGLTTFEFHGDQLAVLKEGDTLWVSVKRMCEVLGLDPAGQRRRIKEEAEDEDGWSRWRQMSSPDIRGRNQKHFMLDVESLPAWLLTAQTKNMKEDVKKKVRLYQREARDALADHFLRGGRSKEICTQSAEEMRAAVLVDFVSMLGPIIADKVRNEMDLYEDRLEKCEIVSQEALIKSSKYDQLIDPMMLKHTPIPPKDIILGKELSIKDCLEELDLVGVGNATVELSRRTEQAMLTAITGHNNNPKNKNQKWREAKSPPTGDHKRIAVFYDYHRPLFDYVVKRHASTIRKLAEEKNPISTIRVENILN
jgi:excisionase family DNA binding protein